MIDERLPLVLIGLLIAVMAMLLFFKVATVQTQKTTYLLDFYAADLPLVIEAMQAVPGDTQVFYPLEDGYTLQLGKGEPTAELKSVGFLTITHDKDDRYREVPIHVLPTMHVTPGSANGIITFTKQDDQITITGKATTTVTSTCPKATTLTPPINILLYSVATPDDTHTSLSNDEVSDIKNAFAQALTENGITVKEVTRAPTTSDLSLYFKTDVPGAKSTLTINIPTTDKATYDAITCSFIENIGQSQLTIQTIHTSAAYSLTFAPSTAQTDGLLNNMASYADAFAAAIKSNMEASS